jgi:hypothetical protein
LHGENSLAQLAPVSTKKKEDFKPYPKQGTNE